MIEKKERKYPYIWIIFIIRPKSEQLCLIAAAMELCTRTFTTTSLLFNPSFSLPSSSSSNSLHLHLHSKFNSFNLSSSSIQPSLFHHTSSPFTVSASPSSSSVELFPENDRLPAELKVTETKESNSRVCVTFFFFFFYYICFFTLSQFDIW